MSPSNLTPSQYTLVLYLHGYGKAEASDRTPYQCFLRAWRELGVMYPRQLANQAIREAFAKCSGVAFTMLENDADNTVAAATDPQHTVCVEWGVTRGVQ
jgi:hypothetical protein